MIDSFLRRAKNKLEEAEYNLNRLSYPESISSSQESIEFSVKSLFLLYGVEYSKKHRFEEGEFVKVFGNAPKDVARIFLLSRFWSSFYTVAKYGYERLGIGAEYLFRREEAELALRHAQECYYGVQALKKQREEELKIFSQRQESKGDKAL